MTYLNTTTDIYPHERPLKAGDVIVITKAERPYVCAGFRSSTNILPREQHVVRIRKITKTKRGRKCHVQGDDYGYAIYLDDLPEFMTVERLA